MNALVNKFIFVNSGKAYRTGKITASVDDHYFLVQFDNLADKNAGKGATLVCLHEMAAACDEGRSRNKVVVVLRHA